MYYYYYYLLLLLLLLLFFFFSSASTCIVLCLQMYIGLWPFVNKPISFHIMQIMQINKCHADASKCSSLAADT